MNDSYSHFTFHAKLIYMILPATTQHASVPSINTMVTLPDTTDNHHPHPSTRRHLTFPPPKRLSSKYSTFFSHTWDNNFSLVWLCVSWSTVLPPSPSLLCSSLLCSWSSSLPFLHSTLFPLSFISYSSLHSIAVFSSPILCPPFQFLHSYSPSFT